MYKKTITYTDLNGKERTEDHYFNINKAELSMLEYKYPEGMDNYLKDVIDREDKVKMMEFFHELILSAYGVKTEDGKHFEKNADLRHKFETSEAFSEIFYSIFSDEKEMDRFVKSVMPKIDVPAAAGTAAPAA